MKRNEWDGFGCVDAIFACYLAGWRVGYLSTPFLSSWLIGVEP